ncbi:MAG: hypothetical protein DMD91_26045 [Candidatus Rokuibacteriota bacterium]|nr:MAG: hypothetical protein DMD91_26045 [Candidatus Rokubacteria bacterium]
MKQRRAAAPYAKAFFAVEKEHNQTGLVGRELGHMAATFESDLALRDFDPLTAIAEKYQRLVDEDLGRVRAHVRTAVRARGPQRELRWVLTLFI